MSHVTSVKTQITDLDAVKEALAKINEEHGVNLSLSAGPGDVRFYYGTQRADRIIKMPGRYDMGFTQQADGSYNFVCDTEALSGNYGRGDDVRALFGDQGSVLLQEYASAKIGITARMEGHSMTRDSERRADGSVVLHVRR